MPGSVHEPIGHTTETFLTNSNHYRCMIIEITLDLWQPCRKICEKTGKKMFIYNIFTYCKRNIIILRVKIHFP